MFKYTNYTLKKIEGLFEAIDYNIRYEKGNFQSGYCIVENKRIAVINKFFDAEARINCLMEVLATVEVEPSSLDEKQLDLYEKLMKWSLDSEEEEPEIEKEEASDEVSQ